MPEPKFPVTVKCVSPGCNGRAFPPIPATCNKSAGFSYYVCRECGSITVIGKAPLIIYGRMTWAGAENSIIVTLASQPEALAVLGES